MEKVSVKGHEIEIKTTKTGYARKATLFANQIIDELKKINIFRDDIRIKTNILGNQNQAAVIEFWSQGHYCRFSYSMANRFIDNLYVLREFFKLEIKEVLEGRKDLIFFLQQFNVEGDNKKIDKDLAEAKKVLGLDESEKDINKINDSYKKLARKNHPDLGGNLEEFQKINKAHKLIKKEMGL